ncbi:hypothetical protein NESM_000383400 [Novymonas esmeraldas]|uniref:Uncharacterized protein n=1 Tax=Novymonas esmeraldas TaxID=1808958 RepID=A0AAW0ENZ3_9TRYP
MGRRTDNGDGGGGAASSTHRHRSHRSDRHRDADHTDSRGDRDRHRRRDGNDADGGVAMDDSRRRHHRSHTHHHHRRHRSSVERRRDDDDDGGGDKDVDAARPDRTTRSHRRPRRERGHSSDEDAEDTRGARSNGGRHRRDAREDDGGRRERGRKHRRDDRLSDVDDDEDGGGGGGEDEGNKNTGVRADRPQREAGSGPRQYVAAGSDAVDWSSRRGRQRMPGLAYDVDQQKRFLGFLDRRDASDGRGVTAAAAMEFTIGADGLVEMPPPPRLVRRSARTRSDGEGASRGGAGTQQSQQQRRPPHHAPATGHSNRTNRSRNDAGDDDDDECVSVASHESLYSNPAMAHLGVLPDVIPPSNLYRVALYGVDLALAPTHLRSMVAQLLGGGAAPWRVRRPAREMLNAAQAQQQQQELAYRCEFASAVAPPGAVLADAPTHVGGAEHLTTASAAGVLSGESEDAGVLGNDGGHGSGVLPDGADGLAANEAADGVLPDASTPHVPPPLPPPPPPPPPPVFYLPGLHDVNGPGGMVVLEFTEQTHAFRTVQLLNGAYINGRRVAASV